MKVVRADLEDGMYKAIMGDMYGKGLKEDQLRAYE